jgi:hypothetical protein
LFEEIETDALRGFCLWLPMLKTDDTEAAQERAAAFPSDRVEHAWDSGRRAGELFARALSLKGVAWDVYLLYAPGITWERQQPPQPSTWMHQLPSSTHADPKQLLNTARLAEALTPLLGDRALPRAPDLGLRLHLKGLDAVRTSTRQH